MHTFLVISGLYTLLLAGCQNSPPQQDAQSGKQVAPDAALRNTRWVARELAGKRVVLPEQGKEPYLLLREDGNAEGQGGCNMFRGTFKYDAAGEIAFGPLASTRMACPAMATESAFNQALTSTRTYRISGDTLWLYDAGAAPLGRLEAVYLR